MNIRTRLGVSLDGYISTSEGLPAFMVPGFETGASASIHQVASESPCMIMGRTTFDPALNSPTWPWPDKRIFVLTSTPLPPGTPGDVVASGDAAALLELVEAACPDGDVQLVGGQRTVQAFRDLGAVSSFGVLLLPILLGDGTRLTPTGSGLFPLHLESTRTFSDGSIEHLFTAVDRTGSS